MLAVLVGTITTDFEPDVGILKALPWRVTIGFGRAHGLPLLYTQYFKFAPGTRQRFTQLFANFSARNQCKPIHGLYALRMVRMQVLLQLLDQANTITNHRVS